MAEHTAQHVDYEKLLFDRASSTLRVHGILSIVFGGLGVLVALLIMFILIVSTITDVSYDSSNGPLGLFIVSMLVLVFVALPHIYLIVAGSYLMKEPTPKIAKTLVIINLVVGVFYNLVLVVMAIINLTQFNDYERGYHVHRKIQQ